MSLVADNVFRLIVDIGRDLLYVLADVIASKLPTSFHVKYCHILMIDRAPLMFGRDTKYKEQFFFVDHYAFV